MHWRKDMENAPTGRPHLRGTWVVNSITREPSHFEANSGYVNHSGNFVNFSGEDFGWPADLYSFWCELPETPNYNPVTP